MSSDNLPMRSATAPLLPHHNQSNQPGMYQQQQQQQQPQVGSDWIRVHS